MTQSTIKPKSLVVAKRLWHGNRFYEAGTPWSAIDSDETLSEQGAYYLQHGFLEDKDAAAKRQNRAAYEANQQAKAKSAEVDALQGRIAELQKKLDDQQNAGDTVALTQERDRLKTQVDALTQERDGLKAQSGLSEADAQALAQYREVVGELLPATDLAPKPYKSLLAGGFYTVKLIQGATDEQLRALTDVAEGTIETLRKLYPVPVPADSAKK